MTATAEYKGRNYKLVWSGQTKYGTRAKLAYFDGSKEFWVDASAIRLGGGGMNYHGKSYHTVCRHCATGSESLCARGGCY